MKNFEEALAALKAIEARVARPQKASECYRALIARELAVLTVEEAAKSKNPERVFELYEELLSAFRTVSPAQFAVELTHELQKNKKNKAIFPVYKAIPENGISICHPKNAYIQKAAAHCPKNSRFFYAEDYEDAVEGVANGEYDACLLPYVAPNGGKLPTVLRLMEEQGLCKTALLFAEHGEEEAGYILLTAHPFDLPEANRLELAVYPPNRLDFNELTLFSEKIGIGFCFPEAFSENADGDFSGGFQLTFKGEHERLKRAAEAISFLCPESRVTGFYAILRER